MRYPLIFFLSFLTLISKGQCFFKNDSLAKRNAIFIELGGNSIFYSINYEYAFISRRYFKTTITTELMYMPKRSSDVKYFPILCSPQINCCFGRYIYFEMGIGTTYLRYLSGRIGLRYQIPSKNSLLVRIGYTPIYTFSDKSYYLKYWGGFSIGYTFGKH